MKELCQLNKSQGIEKWCTRDSCIFWRLLDAQEVIISNARGCGLQYFKILEGIDADVARWLIRMKEKFEDAGPEDETARINFKSVE